MNKYYKLLINWFIMIKIPLEKKNKKQTNIDIIKLVADLANIKGV